MSLEKKILVLASLMFSLGCSSTTNQIQTNKNTPAIKSEQNFQQETYQGIPIRGPFEYISKIKSSLDLIYYNDPINWQIVRRNITLIRLNPPSAIYPHNGILYTNNNKGKIETLEWVASEIVHDAWHREYFRKGEVYLGPEAEKKVWKDKTNSLKESVHYVE